VDDTSSRGPCELKVQLTDLSDLRFEERSANDSPDGP
jgi:hypothetical protein